MQENRHAERLGPSRRRPQFAVRAVRLGVAVLAHRYHLVEVSARNRRVRPFPSRGWRFAGTVRRRTSAPPSDSRGCCNSLRLFDTFHECAIAVTSLGSTR